MFFLLRTEKKKIKLKDLRTIAALGGHTKVGLYYTLIYCFTNIIAFSFMNDAVASTYTSTDYESEF